MAFQFLCPQGHLLQGEESQAGQQCKCPYCDSLFLVPQPAAADAGAAGPPTVAPPGFDSGGYQPPMYEEPAAEPQGAGEEGFPGIQTPGDFLGGVGPDAGINPSELPGAAQQNILHILCPSGHQLETPREMLGQDALCPYCQVQFRLRFEDSLEGKQEKAEERDRKEQKKGRAWMHWAIAAAVVVVFGVIILILLATSVGQ